MKRLLVFAALTVTCVSASLAGTGPVRFQPGPGGNALASGRNVCWSEPPDLNGYLLSSEVIGSLAFATRVGNDIIFDSDRTITKIRWWGGYYQNVLPCIPGMSPSGFMLFFYTHDDCVPPEAWWDPTIQVIVQGSAGETPVGCEGQEYPLYRYEADVNIPLQGGVRYWFVAQMMDHPYPPQWGRLAAATITDCESIWGIDTLEGFVWYQIHIGIGFPLDMSQEFECQEPVAVEPSSWGRIKRLYR